MSDLILKNIKLLDPTQNITEPSERDIWISDGVVKAIDKPGAFTTATNTKGQGTLADGAGALCAPDIQTVDGAGALCAPGLIDMHVHLREPGFEYKETIASGSAAAAAGGFTSVACMANTNPVNDNPYVTQFIIAQASQHSCVRVYPVGALSKGLKGEQLAEIGKMRDVGIVAVSDDGMPVMNSYLMRKALDYCKAFDLTIISHAEDACLVGQGVMHEGYHSNCLGLRGIPAESEEILVARDIALARLTGGRVHFAHLSTRYALEHVRRAKAEGLHVTCEVTPHHLMFRDEDVSSYDSNFKMAPPLRTADDIAALKRALADGTIDCIATDHAPHAPRDKDVLFEFAANGVVGLETAWSVGLGLVREGVIKTARLLELLSSNPARILGVSGGTLKPGSPADFFLTRTDVTRTLQAEALHSKSKNSPFIGRTLHGNVEATYVAGVCKYAAD